MMHSPYAGRWADCHALAERRADHGLTCEASREKAKLLAKAAANMPAPAYADRDCPEVAFFVPGRIELLGKHTDYAGGHSIVAAAERGFCLVARPRSDDRVTVADAADGQSIGFRLAPNLMPRGGHWANYPMTVARRIARNFPAARRGVDVAFASDLPPAAGMSSSSAMIVALFLALNAANHLRDHPEFRPELADKAKLAGYLATIENGQSFGLLLGDRGVGTFGGSEDHTAILCAQPHHVSRYAYCPVEFQEVIPVPAGHVFAIGVSGVVAEKTGAAQHQYNRASRMASAVIELWNRETGRRDRHLTAAVTSSPGAAGELAEIVAKCRHDQFEPPALSDRLQHFVAENIEILPAASAALQKTDLEAFGRLVDRSQDAAERLLGNQIPQTSRLAAAARENGALAASAFGAGFGGSVWAMIDASAAEQFVRAWAKAYRADFPETAQGSSFFLTGAGPAAFQLV